MVVSPTRLRGATALVTGAAHRIGRAIAAHLAMAGSDVVIHYGSSRDAAETTAEQLAAEYGVAASTAQADLSDADAIERLFAAVGERSGRLDVLVNSAARFDSGALTEFDAQRWDRVQAVNVRAPHLCLRSATPLLNAAAEASGRPSSVVNIADMSGVVPWRGYGVHGASKAALLHLTRSAALELAPGVRVNAIVPGAILPPAGESEASESWQSVGERVPMGEPGSPEDVGEAVVFLAGARFVTGEVLFVDGGEHLFGSTKR